MTHVSTKSLKKRVTKRYNKDAPIVVAVKTSNMPHHLPKTKPANNKIGVSKPSSRVHNRKNEKYES